MDKPTVEAIACLQPEVHLVFPTRSFNRTPMLILSKWDLHLLQNEYTILDNEPVWCATAHIIIITGSIHSPFTTFPHWYE